MPEEKHTQMENKKKYVKLLHKAKNHFSPYFRVAIQFRFKLTHFFKSWNWFCSLLFALLSSSWLLLFLLQWELVRIWICKCWIYFCVAGFANCLYWQFGTNGSFNWFEWHFIPKKQHQLNNSNIDRKSWGKITMRFANWNMYRMLIASYLAQNLNPITI